MYLAERPDFLFLQMALFLLPIGGSAKGVVGA